MTANDCSTTPANVYIIKHLNRFGGADNGELIEYTSKRTERYTDRLCNYASTAYRHAGKTFVHDSRKPDTIIAGRVAGIVSVVVDRLPSAQVLRVFENNLTTLLFSPEQPLAMFSRMFPAFRHGRSGNAHSHVDLYTVRRPPHRVRNSEFVAGGMCSLRTAVCLGSFKTIVPFRPTTGRVSETRNASVTDRSRISLLVDGTDNGNT